MSSEGDSVLNLNPESNRWLSFDALLLNIESLMTNASNKNAHQVSGLLVGHKRDFVFLLKNPARSQVDYKTVSCASKDGIMVLTSSKGIKRDLISCQVIEEALLMSSIFDLNELIALELMMTGEEEAQMRFPSMTRGPVSVIIYFHAKKSLVLSLKALFKSSIGSSWRPNNIKEDNVQVFRVVSSFLKDLQEEGIVVNALNLLTNFNVKEQIDILEKNRAFGPGKYKKRLIQEIQDIRDAYAFVVFAYSAQFGLDDKSSKSLLDYVSKKMVIPSKEEDSRESIPQENLDFSSTAILLSLMYALDVSCIFTASDLNDPSVKNLTVVKNPGFLKEVYGLITSNSITNNGIRSIVCLVLGIAVKSLSLVDSDTFDDMINGINCDALIDEAVEAGVFDSLNHLLVNNNPHFSSDDFFILRLHHLSMDIPFVLSSKVKQLREKGEESGRVIEAYAQQGIQGNVVLPFERFLTLLSNFYDKHDKSGSLSQDIWTNVTSHGVSNNRFLVFNKFVKSLLETHCPTILLIPLLKLLSSFAKGSPFSIYSLLKPTSMIMSHQSHQFSLDSFFRQLQHFFNNNLRGHHHNRSILDESNVSGLHHHVSHATTITTRTEFEVMSCFLDLVGNIVRNDKSCSQAIADNQEYNCIPTFIAMISSGVTRSFKASLLKCLACFSHDNPSLAFLVFVSMEHLLPSPQVANQLSYSFASPSPKNRQNVLCFDIEDIEPRNEDYVVTLSFLDLMIELLPHVSCIRDSSKQLSLQETLHFVIHSIFLKLESRVFANQEDKNTVRNKCLKIMLLVLEMEWEEEEEVIPASFSVMRDILQESALFRSIIGLIESMEKTLIKTLTPIEVERQHLSCLELCLKIIQSVIEKHFCFLQIVRGIRGFPSSALMTPTQLFSNSIDGKEADRLATLVKLTSVSDPSIQTSTLKILSSLLQQEPRLSHLILLQVRGIKIDEDYILHGFLESIDSQDYQVRKAVLTMIDDVISSSNGNDYGLIDKLLGFDARMNLRESSFSCLHSIINRIKNNSSTTEETTLGLRIILGMTARHETRSTVLRFLRTSHHLLFSYMNQRKDFFTKGVLQEKYLTEMSFFFRLLSIEIKDIKSMGKTAKDYVSLLLGDSSCQRNFMNLIPDFVVSDSDPEMPNLDLFDRTQLLKTIADCSNDHNMMIDVSRLKNKVMSEVNRLSIEAHNAINAEVKRVMDFATALNESRTKRQEKLNFFLGWRDLTETIILCDSLDLYETSVSSLLLMDLVVALTQLAMNPHLMPSLLLPISSVSLITTSRINSRVSSTQLLSLGRQVTRLLESSSSSDLWSHNQRARLNYYSCLLHVMRGLDSSGDASSTLILSKRLLAKVSSDSLESVELIKILSLSLLTSSQVDSWLDILSNDASLSLLIKSLLTHDSQLIRLKASSESKAFYSFETMMSLLSKIASSSLKASQTLIHEGIIDVLSCLHCLEIYSSCLLNQVSLKVLVNVFRLLVTLSSWNINGQTQIYKFLNNKSPLIYSILSQSLDYRTTKEGTTLLFYVTLLLSKLTTFMDIELYRLFMAFIKSFSDIKSVEEAKILSNVLQGCINFNQTHREYFPVVDK
jgi:hypothetical protein